MRQTIDWWFTSMKNQSKSDKVFKSLSAELPSICSLILDRSCRFQCQHCIFQAERFTSSLPETTVVLKTLRQLKRPKVVHEGRQLTSRQLPLLKMVKSAGYEVGIIESGMYLNIIEEIIQSEFYFDWMDISIDGGQAVHNAQRANVKAWEIAKRGLSQARRVIKKDGKLTSLFTVTALNYSSLKETGDWLLEQYIDEWHLTTMSLRPGIENMRASQSQLTVAIDQMLKFGSRTKPLFLRIYNTDDLGAIGTIVGKETFSKSLQKAEVTQSALVLDIGIPLFFYPQSLAPGETLVIDTDGWWRLPYCIKYTLDELTLGKDILKNDISAYNVLKLTSGTNVRKTYPEAVRKWQNFVGEVQLEKERQVFQKFL